MLSIGAESTPTRHLKFYPLAYDGPVASKNPPLQFVAIAFSDLVVGGTQGTGFEIYSTVVRPYFEELRASVRV